MKRMTRNVLAGVKSMGEFFGTSLEHVSQFNLYIAIYAGRPEWLANVADEYALPRRVKGNGSLPHQYVVPNTEALRAELAVWIIEQLQGEWDMNNRWVSFELDVDAVHYRLRWH